MNAFSLHAITRRQWLVVALLLMGATLLFFLPELLLGKRALLATSGDQLWYWIFSQKMLHPDLYAIDPYYGVATNFSVYMPTFLGLVGPLLDQFGFLNTLFLLMPILSLVFLFTMFILLYKITGRVWLSTAIAILSGFVIPIFPIETWGVFSIKMVMSRTFFLVLAPLFFYGWMAWQAQPKKLIGLFLLMGLTSLLHPLSGFIMIFSFLFAQLCVGRFSLRGGWIALGCGLAALLPMIPFAIRYGDSTGLTAQSTLPPADFPLLMEGFAYRFNNILPKRLPELAMGLEVAGWLVLAALGVTVARPPHTKAMAFFILGCVLLFIGYYAVNFGWLVPSGNLPTMLDLVRSLKYVFFPIIILAACFLARLRNRLLLTGLLALLAVTMNLNYFGIARDLEIKTPFPRLIKHQYDNVRQKLALKSRYGKAEIRQIDALWDVSTWFQRNTKAASTLIHGSLGLDGSTNTELRVLSRRSATYSYKDGGLLYYTNKPLFKDWYRRSKTAQTFYEAQGSCSAAESRWAASLGATHLLCEKARVKAPVTYPLLYDNGYYQVHDLTHYTVNASGGS